MSKILGAVVLLIIAAVAQAYFQYTKMSGLFNLVLLVSFIYLVIAIVAALKNGNKSKQPANIPMPKPAANIAQPTKPVNKPNFKNLLPFAFIIIAVIVYAFREILGQKSFAAFVFIDNLLMVSNTINPVIMWCVLGLFIGLIYGSVVALKKYKLTFKVTLVPVCFFVVFVLLMFVANKPLSVAPLTLYNTQKVIGYNLVEVAATNNKFSRNYSYPATNLLDAKDNTAFVFTTTGDAKQQLSFTFKGNETSAAKNYRCVGFKIKNGNRKSQQNWANFGRLKEFAITISNNPLPTITATAFDEDNGFQEIAIKPIPLKFNDVLTVEALSIYPGKKYATQAAVAELVPVIEYDGE